VTYAITFAPAARRAIAEELPEAVAIAVIEFTYGALAANPRRVGKALRNDLAGIRSARRGTYRVLYSIDDADVVIEVIKVSHRRDVYRS
jgi:mRNA interferase RelE/StbE